MVGILTYMSFDHPRSETDLGLIGKVSSGRIGAGVREPCSFARVVGCHQFTLRRFSLGRFSVIGITAGFGM